MTDATDAGLFGYIGENAEVKNLTVKTSDAGVSCSGKNAVYSGIIAGRNYGTIENCHTSGSATAILIDNVDNLYAYCGGLVGGNYGEVSGCSNSASVAGAEYSRIGGIAGLNDNGSILNCINSGNVNANNSDSDSDVGGIVGGNYNGSISNCMNSGSVATMRGSAGGIVGYGEDGTVENCFSSAGSVSGAPRGGVMGYDYGSGTTFINCAYVTGAGVPEKGNGGMMPNKEGITAIDPAYTDQIVAALSALIDTKTIPLDGSATIEFKTLPGTADITKYLDHMDINIVGTAVTAIPKGEKIIITPVGGGTATITVTAYRYAADFSNIESYLKDEPIECKFVFPVTVTVYATGIRLSQSTLPLESGQTATLTATVTPDDATDKGVTWSSSDNAVASVDENGKVTAHEAGTATITATATGAEKELTAQCTVNVTLPPVPVENVTVTTEDGKTEHELAIGATLKLTVEITPPAATNPAVTWHSSNEAVATVSPDGTVKAVGPGTATITATSVDGKITSPAITITVPGNGDGNVSGGNSTGGSGGGGGGCSAGFGALALLAIIPLAVRRKK